MSDKLTSIIIRTKQRPQILYYTLKSLRNQTVKSFEVVIVEDGKGTSSEVIKKFSDLDIKYICTDINVGRARAGNIGFHNASGDFINFLDDDDMFMPNHVETLQKVLMAQNNRNIVYCASIEVIGKIEEYQQKSISKVSMVKYNQPFRKQWLSYTNMFPIQAVMFSRALYSKFGGFDETLEFLEDWDLWLKYAQHEHFYYVDNITSVFFTPDNSEQRSKRHSVLSGYEKKIRTKYQKEELTTLNSLHYKTNKWFHLLKKNSLRNIIAYMNLSKGRR